MLMPSAGTDVITRKCDCRSPPQSSAAKVARTSFSSSPISMGVCCSSGAATWLTEVINLLYHSTTGKHTFLFERRRPPLHARSVLGPANVSDADLAEIVAGWLGRDPASVELVESSA